MLQKHYFIIYLFMPRGATKNQRRKTKRLESLYTLEQLRVWCISIRIKEALTVKNSFKPLYQNKCVAA